MLSLQAVFDQQEIAFCDFLKIDCEGAEYEMLYNLPTAYFTKIGLFAIEYHHVPDKPEYTPEALSAFLEERGFTVHRYKKYHLFAQANGAVQD